MTTASAAPPKDLFNQLTTPVLQEGPPELDKTGFSTNPKIAEIALGDEFANIRAAVGDTLRSTDLNPDSAHTWNHSLGQSAQSLELATTLQENAGVSSDVSELVGAESKYKTLTLEHGHCADRFKRPMTCFIGDPADPDEAYERHFFPDIEPFPFSSAVAAPQLISNPNLDGGFVSTGLGKGYAGGRAAKAEAFSKKLFAQHKVTDAQQQAVKLSSAEFGASIGDKDARYFYAEAIAAGDSDTATFLARTWPALLSDRD